MKNVISHQVKKYSVLLVSIFSSILFIGCQEFGTMDEPVNLKKVKQVISMEDPLEIILGIRTLTNEEKSYAWHETILEKSKQIVLNKDQQNLISDILEAVASPNYFDRSDRSQMLTQTLENRAKALFTEVDYATTFLRLGNRQKLLKIAKNNMAIRMINSNGSPVITDPQSDTGTGQAKYCSCTSNVYCTIFMSTNGTCYFDENQCYTEGYHVNGCGFTGNSICDGICG